MDRDRDTIGQRHKWTETLLDRDADGQGLGHRRTGTVTQVGRQRGRNTDGQEK
jgi:hypothetical protein